MFKHLITSLLVLSSAAVNAELDLNKPIPAIKSELAASSLLTDITVAGDKLIAVGERGHIIYSSDGETWQQANVPVSVLLTSVDFKNDKVGFATGHDATLLKTIDGGENWRLINFQPELDKPLLSVVASDTNIYAVGAYGLFMASTDGGDEWKTVFHDELLIEDDRLYLEDLKQYDPESYESEKQFLLPHFNDITVISGEVLLAGEAGFFAISGDNGDVWQQIETDYFGSYFSIAGQGSQMYLAGLRGNLFESIDSGLQWNTISTPMPATINKALVTEKGAFFFANSGNLFYQLENESLAHHVFADGKAVMSGELFGDKLVLATESGIKTISLQQLTTQ